MCLWSLVLASSIPVLGLESVCPRKGCPWPWPRIFLCPWPWPQALCPRLHLCKLEHYEIRGLTLDLFASFLTNRYQYLSLENHQSNLKKINYGVPQGSVLGPHLFNVYINEISTSVSYTPRLFADDTCLIVEDKNINDLDKKNYD